MYEAKPYISHENWPPISLYQLSDDVPALQKISCMYCKSTLCRITGRIDKIVSTPTPAGDFTSVTEILCKKCKQMYRLCNIPPENIIDLTDEGEHSHS
jgi:5-methylcytosine-specific restriction endonuclease McrA